MSRSYDKIRHIERQEAVLIETSWVSLRQHKGFGDNAFITDVTEIGPCKESVVTTGAEYEPARVGTPVVERLCFLGISFCHRTALSGREVKQVEVCLMMPNAELSIVRECIAKEASVV